jgi:hypothetical protein
MDGVVAATAEVTVATVWIARQMTRSFAKRGRYGIRCIGMEG